MAEKLEPIVLTFGGGINRRRRPFDIDPQECYDGQNFDLDHQFSALKRRNAFQLMGTAPNAGEIRGYAQLINRSGTISTLIQAGGNVYSWDGSSTFTLVGTCSPTSKLRGMRAQISQLDDLVVITDLNKATVVKQWDGTNFTDFTHNLSSPFYAKFCRIHGERAYFGNVQSGTDTPHVILGSALSDIHTLTVTNRPSTSLSDADPFFIPSSDLKAINGMELAFGVLVFSTKNGSLHVLSGTSAQDFTMDALFGGSEVTGEQAMVNIGNDVFLGSQGRIDTLKGVTEFGDVQSDDVSQWIQPLMKDVTDWTMAYNPALQKVYCFPNNQERCYVFHKSVFEAGKLSPWSKWVTDHNINFQPSCVIPIVDPSSGIPAVYMGDNAGAIYKIEGATAKDGGTDSVTMNRRSVIFRLPAGEVFNVRGTVTYLKQYAATINITFEWGGINVFDQPITITIPAATGGAVYSGGFYYNNNAYYNAGFEGRLNCRDFTAAGHGRYVQAKVEVSSDTDIEIHEIQFLFEAAGI